MNSYFLSIGKISGKKTIHLAAKHNLREIPHYREKRDIDPARTHLNTVLLGATAAKGVNLDALKIMRQHGIEEVRTNGVRAIEFLICTPDGAPEVIRRLFAATNEWISTYFHAPIISSVIHLDETTPHMHTLVLPIRNGKLRGSEMVGNRQSLFDIQFSFFEQVAKPLGFVKNDTARESPLRDRTVAARAVVERFINTPEHLLKEPVYQALISLIARAPTKTLALLSAGEPEQKPVKKSRTFVGIMTKPVKPDRSIASAHFRTNGLAQQGHQQNPTPVYRVSLSTGPEMGASKKAAANIDKTLALGALSQDQADATIAAMKGQ